MRISNRWFDRWLDNGHECESCGDLDSHDVHGPILSGAIVCWKCACEFGEFGVLPQ